MITQSQARMLKAFREAAARLGLASTRARVLAAVSGGPDSMAMLHLLTESLASQGGRLIVAHVNHRTRKSSGRDAAFVRAAAKRLDLPCYVATLPKPKGRPSEADLRARRYRALAAIAKHARGTHLAVAHTAEDQAETVLLRITRGTGLSGLKGMAEASALGRLKLVRPLLGISRADIDHYLKRREILSRTDESNVDLAYARNRVRWKILPELKRINPKAIEALVRLASQAAEASAFMEEEGRKAARRLVRRAGKGVRIPLEELRRLPPALRPLIFQAAYARLRPGRSLDADHLKALDSLRKGSVSLPSRVQARVDGRGPRRIILS